MERLPVLIKTKSQTIEILCDVVSTPHEIAQGLMGRNIMPKDSGMLFRFYTPTTNSFWMLNTKIPLSIAFFNQDGKILDIQDMEPNTITPHSPGIAFMGALEMNRGWFVEHNIKPNDFITLPQQAYPMMLNEEIYYGEDYGKSWHDGIQVQNEGEPFVIPWNEVENQRINYIYPRFLISNNNSFKFHASANKFLSEDLPGKTAYLEKYGPDVLKDVEEVAKRTLGINSYEEGLQNNVKIIQDGAQLFPKEQWPRLLNWYETEPEVILTKGSPYLSQRALAGIAARLSTGIAYYTDSSTNAHRGTREETLGLVHVVDRLRNSSVHIPKDIVIPRSKKESVVIPAGHHTLDTLTDEQISYLPHFKSYMNYKTNLKLAAAHARMEIMDGQPVSLEEFIKRTKTGQDKEFPFTRIPKIGSFEDNIFNKHNSTKLTVDRHGINATANRQINSSTRSEFFSEGPRISKRYGLYLPATYDFAEAIGRDTQYLTNRDLSLDSSLSGNQAFGWVTQIALNGNAVEAASARRFAQSNPGELYLPFPHTPDENCAPIHEFFGY